MCLFFMGIGVITKGCLVFALLMLLPFFGLLRIFKVENSQTGGRQIKWGVWRGCFRSVGDARVLLFGVLPMFVIS